VFSEDGQLKAQPAGQVVSRLLYQGDHQFVLSGDNAIRLTFILQNGRAESVTLLQNGATIPGKRK
jgi:hypothetical protein